MQYGLGAAFISSAAITKELDLGLFKRIDISGVRLNRTLSLVRLLRLSHCFSHVAVTFSLEIVCYKTCIWACPSVLSQVAFDRSAFCHLCHPCACQATAVQVCCIS